MNMIKFLQKIVKTCDESAQNEQIIREKMEFEGDLTDEQRKNPASGCQGLLDPADDRSRNPGRIRIINLLLSKGHSL